MSKIISINSFRRGAGRSSIAANLAAVLAVAGLRVGIADTNLQSPSLHILFGLNEDNTTYAVNDYLWGRCDIEQAAYKLALPTTLSQTGQIFLIPASTKTEEFTLGLRKGYDLKLLGDGFRRLIETLQLDMLIIDAQPGLYAGGLLSIAVSDTLVILLRTDQQDYQGTSIMVDVARKLDVPRLMLIVNEVPAAYDLAAIKSKIEEIYDCEVAAVLPHSEEVMALASAVVFVLRYPEHSLTTTFKQISAKLMA